MDAVVKQRQAAALREMLPGVVTFDAEPWRIPLPAPLRGFRVAAEGKGRIALARIVLEGVAPPEEGSYAVAASHATSATGDPLQGKTIGTGWTTDPWVAVTFAAPAAATALLLHSRPGRQGTRAAQVTLDCEGMAPFAVANHAPRQLAGRIAALEAATTELALALADALPGRPEPALALLEGTRLFRGAAQVLSGAAVDLPRMLRCRWALMDGLLRAMRALAPDARRACLPAAADVLRRLMARDATQEPDPPETALEAMATGVLHDYLATPARRPDVPVERLNLYGRLLDGMGAVATFERMLNAAFLDIGGPPAQTPLMVRVHGVSGPFLGPNARMVLGVMREVQAGLEAAGHRGAICYGTLLGAVREKDFIAHDDDVDMIVELATPDGPAGLLALQGRLRGLGFRVAYDERVFLRVTPPRRNFAVDVFPVVPVDGGHVAMLMEGMRIRRVPRDLVLPLGEIEFRGTRFGAPARPEAFLAERYGPDWQVPQRKIGHHFVAD